MKIICWKATRLLGLSGLVAVCGCVTPQATTQTAGLTSQQLVNVAEKPQPSSWLPKLPLPAAGKASSKSGSASRVEETPDREAAAKAKKEPADLMSLARLNERRGQTDLAKQMYRRELEKNPQNGRAHHRLAVIAASEEQWEESNKNFAAAEQLLPGNSELYCDMGYALYLQHRLEPAEAYLRKAIEASPRNQAAHNNLGIVLGVQGRFDESFAEFRRVGTEAEAHTNLAYVYAQLGDIDRAMASLNQALALDSNLRVAAVALLQLNEVKKRLAPDEETAVQLANRDPVKDPASTASSPNAVFQRQTVAGPQQAEPAADNTQLVARPSAAEKLAIAEKLAAAEKAATAEKKAVQSPEPVARRTAQASELVEQVVDGPAKSAAHAKSLAPLATTSPERTQPAASNSVAGRQATQYNPWQSAPQRPSPVGQVTALAPRGSSELPPAVVENQHVTVAKPAVKDDPSPAGQPPRSVAARPLPSKDRVATSKPLTPAPASNSLARSSEASPVSQIAEPRAGDASHTVPAVELATSSAAQVTPASVNLAGSNRSKAALAPPPAVPALAPIVTPTERMQQIQAKQRPSTSTEKPLTPARTTPRPSDSSKSAAAKDTSLLSMLPSAQFGGGGMMPAAPQAPEDPANPASLLPTRQASVPIPRSEHLMPADALIHQAPTSALHPMAQSTWSSSSQPLRFLTDQAGMSAARAAEQAAEAASEGRSGSPGGFKPTPAGSSQPVSGSLPKNY